MASDLRVAPLVNQLGFLRLPEPALEAACHSRPSLETLERIKKESEFSSESGESIVFLHTHRIHGAGIYANIKGVY